ncbi:MAG: lasso RiPP family leader peptide-containing protein [Gammaproteobacteria bacterium]
MPKTIEYESRRASMQRRSKRKYTSPKLVEYGSVKKLTAGVNGSNFDPGHASVTKHGQG